MDHDINTESPTLVPSDHALPTQVRAGAERLSQIAMEMDRFLSRQIALIEDHITNASSSATDGQSDDQRDYAKLCEEFQRVREQWESERDEERDRLIDESRRLVEAWKTLEAEQRETLKMRVLKSESPKRTPIPDQMAPQARGTNAPVEASPEVASTESKSPTSRSGPAQFQQLRREMLEHARQKRKR